VETITADDRWRHQLDEFEQGLRVADAMWQTSFKVVYTCLDGDGARETGGYEAEGAADAAGFCEKALAYQESEMLPQDAQVMYRVGSGVWQVWGGESR
jgi:hypothetical protein